MTADVVHLTHDGILQPLGRSQVVRIASGLAARGLPQHIASLERASDLADSGRVEALARELGGLGIGWSRGAYLPGGGAGAFARNVARLTALSLRQTMRRGPHVVVARSFSTGPTAVALKRLRGARFIYDIRGFWVERRLQTSLSGASPRVSSALRALDRLVYRESAAVVSLTELGADIVRGGRFGEWDAKKPAVCVPTCVDYDVFRPDLTGAERTIPEEIDARLEKRLVIGYVGSVNADYRVAESVRLFRFLLERRNDALLLCLTGDRAEMQEIVAREGVPDAAVVFAKATHEEMPAWLSRVDWGLLLLEADFSKSASMPTKLGEFFASGVRPVHFGCNAEVGDWVMRTGSGITLGDLTDASLRRAADAIAGAGSDPELLRAARERARAHFSVASGLDRYEALIRGIAPA